MKERDYLNKPKVKTKRPWPFLYAKQNKDQRRKKFRERKETNQLTIFFFLKVWDNKPQLIKFGFRVLQQKELRSLKFYIFIIGLEFFHLKFINNIL